MIIDMIIYMIIDMRIIDNIIIYFNNDYNTGY